MAIGRGSRQGCEPGQSHCAVEIEIASKRACLSAEIRHGRSLGRNPPWAWLSAEIDYREKSDFVAMRKPVMCNCQIVPSMGVAKTKRENSLFLILWQCALEV
jgi:hypothetical protein